MEVRKSDNSIEEYSPEKVKHGVCEAYKSTGESCPEGLIDTLVKNLFIYDKITSKEIRRQIEESLMSINKKVAKAYIVLKNGYNKSPALKQEIKDLCKKNLAIYSIPKDFEFRKSLPNTLLGKVDYKKLKDENN